MRARTAIVMGMLLVGCARLADLGGSGDTTSATSETGDGGIGASTGDPNIEITPTSLDFGPKLACGTDSTGQLVTITNKGDSAVTYTAQAPLGAAFRFDGASNGSIPAKGHVLMNVIANPNVAGDNAADLLVTAGEAVQPIHAKAVGDGATFELVQTVVAFGDVRYQNGSTPVAVQVHNNGTETLSVAKFTSTSAGAAGFSEEMLPLSVAPGGMGTFTVKVNVGSGADPSPLEAMLTPVVSNLCGPAPVLAVSGRRVNSDFTVGGASWGSPPCNSSPAAMTVLLSNFSTSSVTYTIKQASPSAFRVTTPASGTATILGATGATPVLEMVTVTPNALGTSLTPIAEALTFSMSSADTNINQTTQTAMLTLNPVGAILSITPSSLAIKRGDKQMFTVKNTGNVPVTLDWSFGNFDYGWGANPPTGIPFGGVGQAGMVSPSGMFGSSATATLIPSPHNGTVAECEPFPSLSLSVAK